MLYYTYVVMLSGIMSCNMVFGTNTLEELHASTFKTDVVQYLFIILYAIKPKETIILTTDHHENFRPHLSQSIKLHYIQ